MTDSDNVSDTHNVVLTIVGTNDAPTLSSIESSSLAYTENDGARSITSSLSLA
ncbi:MAG: hypothetical protein U0936_16410 [Planctomycetaceae bacterium]